MKKPSLTASGDVLRPSKGLIKKQINEVKAVIVRRLQNIAAVDPYKVATTLKQYAPDLLDAVFESSR